MISKITKILLHLNSLDIWELGGGAGKGLGFTETVSKFNVIYLLLYSAS